jgi:hypothetical protein
MFFSEKGSQSILECLGDCSTSKAAEKKLKANLHNSVEIEAISRVSHP